METIKWFYGFKQVVCLLVVSLFLGAMQINGAASGEEIDFELIGLNEEQYEEDKEEACVSRDNKEGLEDWWQLMLGAQNKLDEPNKKGEDFWLEENEEEQGGGQMIYLNKEMGERGSNQDKLGDVWMLDCVSKGDGLEVNNAAQSGDNNQGDMPDEIGGSGLVGFENDQEREENGLRVFRLNRSREVFLQKEAERSELLLSDEKQEKVEIKKRKSLDRNNENEGESEESESGSEESASEWDESEGKSGKILKKEDGRKKVMQKCKGVKRQKVEEVKGLFKCETCGKICKKNQHLIEHKRIHSGEKPYACGECDKKFRLKHHLVEHERTHTGERPYACEQCDREFNSQGNLNKHLRIHARKNDFKCDLCSCSFTESSYLKRHYKIHAGERDFKCETCGKAFNKKHHLNEHKKIHEQEKPFKCGNCGQGFIRKNDLTRHEMWHTGEKPYKCGICEMSFVRSSILMDHQRTHTGERPYKCEGCGQYFTRKGDLSRHKRVSCKRKAF